MSSEKNSNLLVNMPETQHPSCSTQFLIDRILASGNVVPESYRRVGNSISFLLTGDKPVHKALISFREIDGEVNFIQSTALAILHGFMGDLLVWYEENKNWKEGGYIVSDSQDEAAE